MSSNVWILGGYQSDFARNLAAEGRGIDALTAEVIDGTLAAAAVRAEDIGVVHVGNAFGELFIGQGHLGAMPATVRAALWGVPAARHEAACASGGIAVLAALSNLRAGLHDCALVLGIEIERCVPRPAANAHMATAAWAGHEEIPEAPIWAAMFDRIAAEYERRHGLDPAHLRRIGQINFANARRNPNAQTRGWVVPDLTGPGGIDEQQNPGVCGRLRRYDCSQLSDGGAGVVLAGDRFLAAHPDLRPLGRIAGWGHRTAGLSLAAKLERSANADLIFPHVRDAFADALARAGVTLAEIAGLETHDCFSASEYMAIDHIGLTAPGESWKAIVNGDIARDGRFPINPSGGLMGGGHPVGATGVRMLLDAAKQVGGRAGDYQVEGARRFATLNIGGSTTTTVCFVVEAVADR